MKTKVKTSELTGAALDWAVAKCEGTPTYVGTNHTMTGPCINDADLVDMSVDGSTELNYSTNWAQGGPIIEREKITLNYDNCGPTLLWEAKHFAFDGTELQCEYGPTPLIAAMRCYVASKLGDEVELPEEMK